MVTINGGASNGGATVTTADLDASNGVIHVVSNVIGIPTLVNHVVAIQILILYKQLLQVVLVALLEIKAQY